jgi:oligopeptide/dipeptide ABC transporter ATP-binding protein
VITYHERVSRKEAHGKVISLFNMVGIPEPENRVQMYPHEFSGGMRQRVCIARALAVNPDILIADEPTTNLDVTIQAQVLELMKDLQKRLGMSIIIITHDMGIVADLADRVVVLYAGNVCETAPRDEIFYQPKHPYTQALLASVPRLDKDKEMQIIGGNIPNLIDPPSGCRFHPRCPYAVQKCAEEVPQLDKVGINHEVACHRWRELTLTGVA